MKLFSDITDRKRSDKEGISIILLSALFIAGFFFHHWEFSREYVMKITDIFLFISNSVVFFFLFYNAPTVKHEGRLVIWSLIAFISTYFLELAGIYTGMVFGRYYYGDTMFLKIANVPLVIAFNWLILILAVNSISLKIIGRPFLSPLIASFLILIFDFVMEPVAMMLDYWQWEAGVIPLKNYIAWFLISLILGYLITFMRIDLSSKLLRAYFFIQLMFFIAFRVFPV